MAIDPLLNMPSATPIPERVQGMRGGDSNFVAMLDSLRGHGDLPAVKAEQAAAELLKIEMMRNTLSLADESEAPHNYTAPVLSELLARFAENTNQTPETKSATPPCGEVSSKPSTTGADAGDIGRTAFGFLGTPYLFGGEGQSGIDCSSFVQQVFREHRIELPRTAREQSTIGSEVAKSDLRQGDLVFFSTYASYPSHVGIYLGNGTMIHASSEKGEVTVSSMNSDYYRSRFLGARRIA